jgi:uncharacterized membrane protein YfhO
VLLQKDFDPAREVLLYDVPGTTDTSGFARAVATVESYRTNEVIVRTFAEKDRLLVLSDTFYPGWIAELDGSEVGIMKGNLCQRVVAVPKGDHVVRFHFDAPTVKVGLAITVAGLVFAVLLMVIPRRVA